MKFMSGRIPLLCTVILCLLCGQSPAADVDELATLLQEFLAAADEEQAHASFWAADLVYTSSAGLRFGKAEIMAGFDATDADEEAADDEPAMVYAADEVDIRIHGDTAIVAFRLVGTPVDAATGDVLYYFNTGTFLKRDGAWQVIAWQATKIPPAE